MNPTERNNGVISPSTSPLSTSSAPHPKPSRARSASVTEIKTHVQKQVISSSTKTQRRTSVPPRPSKISTHHQLSSLSSIKVEEISHISSTTFHSTIAADPTATTPTTPPSTTAASTTAISTAAPRLSSAPSSLAIAPPALPPFIAPAVIDLFTPIQQKANTDPTYANFSTQKLIRTLVRDIKRDLDFTVVPEGITSKLVTDHSGKVIVEPYTLTMDGKDQTFYKVQAKYTLRVVDNGQDKVVEFTRPIYTTATSPEVAIFAASQYKEAVIQLAQAPIDATDYNNPNSRVKNYNQLPRDKRPSINDERSLRFHIAYDTNGKPKNADYFYADIQDQSPLKIEWGAKPAARQKYERQASGWEIKGLMQQDPVPRSIKEIFYSSEDEALSEMPYVIPRANAQATDDSYALSIKIPDRLDMLKTEKEKRDKEFKELQEKFKKKSFFGGKIQDTSEYKELKAGIQAFEILKTSNNIPSDLQRLSSNSKREIATRYHTISSQLNAANIQLPILETLKQQLESFLPANRNQNLTDQQQETLNAIRNRYQVAIARLNQPTAPEINGLIQSITQDINQIKAGQQQVKLLEEQLGKEQTIFNRHLFKLEALNQELQNTLNELENIQEGANRKITAIGIPPAGNPSPDLHQAQQTQQALTQPIASLREDIAANHSFINMLLGELGLMQEQVVVSDIIPVSIPNPRPN